MANRKYDSTDRRDVLLLQDILKRRFRFKYGINQGLVKLNKVTILAEFDLEYKYVGEQHSFEDVWIIKNGNKEVMRCAKQEYLRYLISAENNESLKKLKNKVNHAIERLKEVLMHVDFETGKYSKTSVNDRSEIQRIFSSTRSKVAEYSYDKEFDIKPYLDMFLSEKDSDKIVNKIYSSNIAPSENNRVYKIVNSKEKLVAAINRFHTHLLEGFVPELQDLSPKQVQKKLEEYYFSVIIENTKKQARELIFDKNLKDNIDKVVAMCNAKPKDWLKESIKTLDNILIEYKDFVSPLVYADLLVFNAGFITKYGLSNTFKQHKQLPESWICAIEKLYLEAIDISISHKSSRKRIQYSLEYANFLYDNRYFHLAGEYYHQVLSLSEKASKLDSISYEKAFADALYATALYHEEFNELEKAQEYYQKAQDYYKTLRRRNIQDRYLSDEAKTLNNLGNLFKTLYNFDRAKSHLENSKKIYENLLRQDVKYKIQCVIVHRNLALVYGLLGDNNAAYNEIKYALKAITDLAENDPDEYNCDMAYLLLDYAALNSWRGDSRDTMSKYEQSLSLFRELAVVNPDKHIGRVAWTLNKFVIFHKMYRNYASQALPYFKEALEIYEALADKSSRVYDSSVARALNLLADTYMRLEKYNEAFSLQMRAYAIYLKLSEQNPVKYNSNVAWTLNSLSIISWKMGDVDQARERNHQAMCIYDQIGNNTSGVNSDAKEWSKLVEKMFTAEYTDEMFSDCLDRSLDIFISDLYRRTRRHLL